MINNHTKGTIQQKNQYKQRHMNLLFQGSVWQRLGTQVTAVELLPHVGGLGKIRGDFFRKGGGSRKLSKLGYFGLFLFLFFMNTQFRGLKAVLRDPKFRFPLYCFGM